MSAAGVQKWIGGGGWVGAVDVGGGVGSISKNRPSQQRTLRELYSNWALHLYPVY